MAILLHAPRTEIAALLDAYAAEFDWYSFCMAFGHLPARGQDALQALYEAQARWRGHRMQELYPLVCAHWDVVNLAHQLADARSEPQRRPLAILLKQAKARHRDRVQALHAAWAAEEAAAR